MSKNRQDQPPHRRRGRSPLPGETGH